jgi:hypothetical protein
MMLVGVALLSAGLVAGHYRQFVVPIALGVIGVILIAIGAGDFVGQSCRFAL